MIAAPYVDPRGSYTGLPNIDLWTARPGLARQNRSGIY